MRFFIGLGNPGVEYQNTRHNFGFLVIDRLAQFLQLSFTNQPKWHTLYAKKGDLILAKPQTYMNDSGQSVQNLLRFYDKQHPKNKDYENLIVAHDDLDLRLGATKLVFSRGPKVHNGINSIREAIGSEAFWYQRLGIDNREPSNPVSGSDYVLAPFAASERDTVEQVVDSTAQRLYDTFCT